MRRFLLPLKYSIPAILLGVGSLLSVVSFYWEAASSDQRIEATTRKEISFSGNQTSGLLEYLYSDLNGQGNDRILAHIGSGSNVKLMVLADENYRVLSSTRFQLQGELIRDTPFGAHLPAAQVVQQSKSGQIVLSADRKTMTIIYPVGLKFSGGSVVPDKIGVLLIDYDLGLLKAIGYQEAQRRSLLSLLAFSFIGLLLWLFFNQAVTQRVARLVATSNSLAQGDLSARSNLGGADELAQVSHAFDQMAAQIQNNIAMINRAQAQLIQAEKMSSLGQMVAGIAHEVNNPVSFIHGNLQHAGEYIQGLFKLIELYQTELANPTPAIQAHIEDIDLDFIQEDLPKILSSMHTGTERIRSIVLSLRNFSRLDESELKHVNLHEGIESTLVILGSRLKETSNRQAIEVTREYGDLPEVACYAGHLNQVFMNILVNAIDAFEYSAQKTDRPANELPTIRIQTEKIDSDYVSVCIIDNGPGISEQVKTQLFDPFFTTKPVGQGTGLGLSISYQIAVEMHRGDLQCVSQLGKGTKFQIKIPVRARVTAC